MSCGCASEYLGLGDGYAQYPDSESFGCSCHRIFCRQHAKEHRKRYPKHRMTNMFTIKSRQSK